VRPLYLNRPLVVPAERERPSGLGRIGDSPTTVETYNIPEGIDGVAATLRIMKKAANDSLTTDKSGTILLLARQLFSSLEQRDWKSEVSALHEFVRDYIRYTQDPDGIELIQTPVKTLELQQGDCDDKSTLLAALLKAGGHPARFRAVGMDGEDFSHVLVEAKMGETWVPLETILDVEMGWCPPNITRNYILKV
jgi:transglutaminase-like putative cysteine protease